MFWASASRRRCTSALVDVDGQVTHPDAEVLTVRTTCSNFDLPSRLPFGLEEGDFAAEDFPAMQKIVALRRPTPSYDPPGRERPALAAGFTALAQLLVAGGRRRDRASRKFCACTTSLTRRYLENQIGGITALSSRPHFAIMQSGFGNIPARGMRLEVDFDERQFVGGGVYLFANVLDRFLGYYTSINSFCQLAARTNQRKEMLGEWPPRAGNKPLI